MTAVRPYFLQSEDRALVAVLHKLVPEDDEAGVGIASAHVGDELDFLRGKPVRVVTRPAGPVAQGFDRAVVTVFHRSIYSLLVL